MKIQFRDSAPADPQGALVLLAAEDAKLTPAATVAERATDGQLGRAMKAANFKGAKAATLDLLAPSGLAAERILLLGLGAPEKADAHLFEELGGKIVEHLQLKAEGATVDLSGLSGLPIPLAEAAAHLALGATLRAFRHDRWKTRLKDHEKPKLATVTVAGAANAEPAFAPLRALADGVALARELVTEPANIIYPETFVDRVKAAAEPLGLGVTILDEAQMRQLGFGALLGVAQGSARPPRLIALEWKGADGPPLAFVGKGVTFDTGGISIKPAAGMEDMKWDMGGAAAVAGAMVALAGRKARAHVVGVC
ncbi:MAG: M17 family peptidase N-terminal domain-containing protein, partial [Sphingomonadaceae bacterium]